jgi:hypothetical protein
VSPAASTSPADAPRAAGPPTITAEKRNWLLARLIVDQNFDADKVRSIEQKLQNMSADQVDVLARVYQQKQQQREIAAQAVLDEARENLENLKATRDALAEDVANVRAAQQQQYVNYGVTYGGTNALGYGYNPFGFGPYGAGGFVGRPFGMGYGAMPAYGYSLGYGYGGYPAIGYGSAFGYGLPLGYAAPYPVYGGVYGGWGAGY